MTDQQDERASTAGAPSCRLCAGPADDPLHSIELRGVRVGAHEPCFVEDDEPTSGMYCESCNSPIPSGEDHICDHCGKLVYGECIDSFAMKHGEGFCA